MPHSAPISKVFCCLSASGDALNLIEDFLTNGLQTVRVFDPATRTYKVVGEMERGRWYPSTNVLANGDVLIVGGMQQASTSVRSSISLSKL